MMALDNIADTARVQYSLNTRPNTKIDGNKVFDKQAAQKAAEDFEAFFITTTLESMFAGVEPNSVMGGGTAEKIYRSMLFDEYGKLMAKNGTVGVSTQVMASILAMQESSVK